MTVQLCSQCRSELPAGTICSKCGHDSSNRDASRVAANAGLSVGDVIDGHWRLLEKLGEGGMGTVYLAMDLRLDRHVAIKFLHPDLFGSELSRMRFEREAKLAAQLDHPNIVPIFGYGTHGDRAFIVMKYVEGDSLEAVIAAHKRPFTWAEARSLLAPLLDGLGHLHARAMVHRDVKPQNAVVGSEGRVTLLDFGLMREVAGEATQPGMVVGTMRYMAPEQLVGATLDARADLYAIGLILFQMLTGRHAFDGDSLTIARKKLEAEPPSLRVSGTSFPLAVVGTMRALIAREPEKRPASAAEAIRLLDEAFASPPPPPPPRGKAARWVVAPVMALVTGGLILGLASARSTQQSEAATIEHDAGASVVASPTSPPPDAGALEVTAFERVDGGAAPEPLVVEVTPGKSDRRPTVKKAPAKVRLVRVAVLTRLDSRPSFAELEVDGERVGETPIQLELAPGAHQFRVTRQGFPPLTKSVSVRSAATDRIVFDLIR